MRHVILEAMERLKKYEETIGKSVPKPTYLLEQRYGRTLEPLLKEMEKAYGKKQSVLLRKEPETRESLLEKFQVEAKKVTDLGKRFDGLVVVELNQASKKEEREVFYEYIRNNPEKIACVFTVKNEENVEYFRKELEQNFPFVRRVSEECYDSEEQVAILAESLRSGGIGLTLEAEMWIGEELEKVKWSPSDNVENRLKNLANNLVYERIINGTSFEPISAEEVRSAVKQQIQPESEKITIGFAPPKEKEQESKKSETDGKELVA